MADWTLVSVPCLNWSSNPTRAERIPYNPGWQEGKPNCVLQRVQNKTPDIFTASFFDSNFSCPSAPLII